MYGIHMMYGLLPDELSIEHNDWLAVIQSSVHFYNYLGIDVDYPLLAFNNWEKNNV